MSSRAAKHILTLRAQTLWTSPTALGADCNRARSCVLTKLSSLQSSDHICFSDTQFGGRFTTHPVRNNTSGSAQLKLHCAVLSIEMVGRCFALLFVALCGLTHCAALPATGQSAPGRHSNYRRPPAADAMPVDHHLLTRHSSQPHSPEQIATALSGPGTLSISWVRHCAADAQLCVGCIHVGRTACLMSYAR